MVELRKIDILKNVSKKLVFSILIIFLLVAVLYYFGYDFESIFFNSILFWIANHLLKFSILVSALNFENMDDYRFNSNLDHLMEKEAEFIKEHPSLTVYNAIVYFMSMMINIIIVIYLIVGLCITF